MIINILTFSKVYNRGANMQAYALKTFLEKNGAKVLFIDIQLPKSKTLNFSGYIFDFFQNALSKIFRVQTKFKFTKKYSNSYELKKDPPIADVFVVGSDQVWNPDITKNLGSLTYFFDFLPNKAKRVSYAASIGTKEWKHNELCAPIKECLKKFNAVSVREDSACEICKSMFDIDAKVVVDPTLLLSEQDLRSIIGRKKNVENTTFTYLLYNDERITDYVKTIHSLSGNITLKGLTNSKLSKILNIYTIKRWLKKIESSNLIITNSFHCMVMSILLHKNFVVIPPYPGRETRILSLLNKIGLCDRYIDNIYDEDNILNLISSEIDYKKVDEQICLLRKESEAFIYDNIL